MSQSKASKLREHKYLMSIEARRMKGIGSSQRKKSPRHGGLNFGK